MWSSAAYDFPADCPVIFAAGGRFNRKDWAVRAGLFEVPSAPNSDISLQPGGRPDRAEDATANSSTISPANSGSASLEIEGQSPTIARRWLDGGGNPRSTSTCDGGHYPPQPAQYGFYANAEQQIVKGRRIVCPRELERRPERNPFVHRYRSQPVGRRFDQGQLLGPSRAIPS